MVDNNWDLSGGIQSQIPWVFLVACEERDALYGIVFAIRCLQFFEKYGRFLA